MKKVTRLFALIMVLCFAVIAFAACGGDDAETGSKGEVSVPEEMFTVPKTDFGGETVTILVEGENNPYTSVEMKDEETSPLVLNENIIRRNELVESHLNVKLEVVYAANSNTSSTENMQGRIDLDVKSGSGEYDLAMPYVPTAANLTLSDSFALLNGQQYIDLDAPCWDSNATKSLSINNKNYFLIGDANLLALACTHAIVFNKDIISSHGLEDPYTLVTNGEWTIDKLSEMAREVTADVDGTTGMSYTDTYGFLINSNFVTSMYIGSGRTLTGKDANDRPYIKLFDESVTAAATFSKIFELVNDQNATGQIDNTTGTYYTSATNAGLSVWTAATESVANKKALFRAMSIIDILDLGNYECNFGIIPVPKFDTMQDDHYSLVSTLYASTFAIPATAPNIDMSAAVMQCLSEASTDTTKYAYMQTILKERKLQDYESEEMLEIIFANRVYDLGIVFNWGGTGPYDANSIANFMNGVAFSGTMTFQSRIEEIQGVVNKAIETTMDKFTSKN